LLLQTFKLTNRKYFLLANCNSDSLFYQLHKSKDFLIVNKVKSTKKKKDMSTVTDANLNQLLIQSFITQRSSVTKNAECCNKAQS